MTEDAIMMSALCEKLGIEFPLFAFSHCRDVIVQVSKAGGMGVLGAAGHTPESLEIELDWIDAHIDGRPYGVDLIVPNSIDADGTKAGYDIEITRRISENVGVPVVASGGAGKLEHMVEVLEKGKADAVLAASIFHFGEYTVGEVKEFLAKHGVTVRVDPVLQDE